VNAVPLDSEKRKKIREHFKAKTGINAVITIDPKNLKKPIRSYMNKYTHDLEELVINQALMINNIHKNITGLKKQNNGEQNNAEKTNINKAPSQDDQTG